jgi:Family of unknown function (DUF5939)
MQRLDMQTGHPKDDLIRDQASLQLPAEFVIVFEPVTHAAQFVEVKGEPGEVDGTTYQSPGLGYAGVF